MIFKHKNTFKNRSLLQFSKTLLRKQFLTVHDVWFENCITVHDVLHDLEIRIGEEENCVFRAAQSIGHFPHIEVPHDCKRISVRHNSIRSESLPELVSLALGENRDMGKIPDGFFLNFTSLRVLELSGIDALKSLPPSLWQLTQLQYPCW